ncbi:MAG TPA: hypothetical protein VGM84_12060 [Steroidobacteraceae bacterium]
MPIQGRTFLPEFGEPAFEDGRRQRAGFELCSDVRFSRVDFSERIGKGWGRLRLRTLLLVEVIHRHVGGSAKRLGTQEVDLKNIEHFSLDIGNSEASTVRAGAAVMEAAAHVVRPPVLHVAAAAL